MSARGSNPDLLCKAQNCQIRVVWMAQLVELLAPVLAIWFDLQL